ncbi:hypothetical protein GQ43DRAFT_444728 [Delitschia confertaspora ATCC 74209]|uniref:NADH-ubiquinone oxidoreductase 17.8 kDa subunit n=1 Tax=Delitschia confertaspora ATCC 74209 TaxID=1513339 RepID=A0A9P4MNE0_9PLEO|nr:hypothetical protein GQ43DRAFT_444728 [Delitschia confertaspora ATCC 74209]
MQPLRRAAATAARETRTTLSRHTRRYAHDDHSHKQAPVNESFGTGFYLPLALIPSCYGLYLFSRPTEGAKEGEDKRPFFTRWLAKYTDYTKDWEIRNDMHVRMIEQAGRDKALFLHAKPTDTVELRFPDQFNVGSPYNVSAGSQVNLSKVIAKYEREAYADNEQKLEDLRNGTLKAEQTVERRFRDKFGEGPM